jgi:hypothetical protein
MVVNYQMAGCGSSSIVPSGSFTSVIKLLVYNDVLSIAVRPDTMQQLEAKKIICEQHSK